MASIIECAAENLNFLESVEKCDVVVVGKEECAAGLSYDENIMDAPAVVYKSLDADYSRRLAEECKVVVVESNPVSRWLMWECEIGCLIPEYLWHAVADVYRMLPKFMDASAE